MGGVVSTNFYVISKPCEHCGRSDGEIHLGKASFGWKFTLQANNFKWYQNWEEMKEWLKDKEIEDEYGSPVDRDTFIKWVENRQDIIDPASQWTNHRQDEKFVIDGYKFHNHEFC